ncbi:hypothetical protein PMIT1327_02667 [Prochlorococcus marinus str. MIT 1327]|nr:hypothetical protein PMIT1312_01614 [Prochlorococcus marinus str. MIT 1312]KZR79458.1 hypothetical protein PMIT1327_02667 [Prochlorococcus marinus str. MIT 1327]
MRLQGLLLQARLIHQTVRLQMEVVVHMHGLVELTMFGLDGLVLLRALGVGNIQELLFPLPVLSGGEGRWGASQIIMEINIIWHWV